MHTAQGHALWATATRSKFPPSLSGEACLSPPTRCRPNHRGRRQPGPSAAARPGPARSTPSVLCPWPLGAGGGDSVAPAARARPSSGASGRDPVPHGPRLSLVAVPWSPAPGLGRTARSGERGRGKAGPGAGAGAGGGAAPPLRTMPTPRAAGEEPAAPPQPPARPGSPSEPALGSRWPGRTTAGFLGREGRRDAAALRARSAARPGLGGEAGQGRRGPGRDELAAPRSGVSKSVPAIAAAGLGLARDGDFTQPRLLARALISGA